MLSWWLNEIAGIGTGNIGGTLARKLSAAGHDLRIANARGLEDVRAFANEIEATAADTRRAVNGVDLIILSIPFAAVAELPNDLFDPVPQDVPVIDAGNVFEPLYQALYPHWSGSIDLYWAIRRGGSLGLKGHWHV